MLGKLQILGLWKFNISVLKCKYPVNKTRLYHRLHGERDASSKFGSEVKKQNKTLISVEFCPRTRPQRNDWLLKSVFLGLGGSHPSPRAPGSLRAACQSSQ